MKLFLFRLCYFLLRCRISSVLFVLFLWYTYNRKKCHLYLFRKHNKRAPGTREIWTKLFLLAIIRERHPNSLWFVLLNWKLCGSVVARVVFFTTRVMALATVAATTESLITKVLLNDGKMSSSVQLVRPRGHPVHVCSNFECVRTDEGVGFQQGYHRDWSSLGSFFAFVKDL